MAPGQEGLELRLDHAVEDALLRSSPRAGVAPTQWFSGANESQLRDVGLDERWLQDQIVEDPSIPGLGDLAVLQRERKQPTGDPDWFVAVFCCHLSP